MNLKNKTIILGVTGSIAAYKMANVASALAKAHCDVHTIMTKNATEIITPLTFSTLTGNNCIVDTFDKTINYNVAHVALAKRSDLLLIAPATANIIAKLAYGLADDMLTTTALACTCPKIIAPAMNTAMYNNPIVQKNINILKDAGYIVIDPAEGMLACKDLGVGKLADESLILDYIQKLIAKPKDMNELSILITAGPTQEAIDPVRFITNHSSGKMGYALAYEAMLRGANVTLVSGPTNCNPIPFTNHISVNSSQEMYDKVMEIEKDFHIIIKAAAVADYTPETYVNHKVKKSDGNLEISLKRTHDILKSLGENKNPKQYLCGFAMETENLIENSKKKLKNKKADMIVANSLSTPGAGFSGDTNVVTLITQNNITELPIMTKSEVAEHILNHILANLL